MTAPFTTWMLSGSREIVSHPAGLSTKRNGMSRLRCVAAGPGPARRPGIRSWAGEDAGCCLPSYTWRRVRPQKRRRPPARGAIQRQPQTARSDPDFAWRPGPDPELKASNRGQTNRPAG
jgi:hypothetical protein